MAGIGVVEVDVYLPGLLPFPAFGGIEPAARRPGELGWLPGAGALPGIPDPGRYLVVGRAAPRSERAAPDPHRAEYWFALAKVLILGYPGIVHPVSPMGHYSP